MARRREGRVLHLESADICRTCVLPSHEGRRAFECGALWMGLWKRLAPGERRRARGHWRMALVVVLVRAGQRERGAFT